MLQSLIADGNALSDGAPRGGWFVGPFIDSAFGPRHRASAPAAEAMGDCEWKCARHPAGDRQRGGFAVNRSATNLWTLLAPGRLDLFFCRDDEWSRTTLREPGDYAIWNPSVAHFWIASEPCFLMIARWPAVANDQSLIPYDDLPNEIRRLFRRDFIDPVLTKP